MSEEFQSQYVFGLQGKQYQEFLESVAKPIIEKVIGRDEYEIIPFNHHLSYKDFQNNKVSIFPNFYTSYLTDIIKTNNKVSFKTKVCICLDERLCIDICPNTGEKITTIKLAGVDLAYFIYFDIKEFFDFVYEENISSKSEVLHSNADPVLIEKSYNHKNSKNVKEILQTYNGKNSSSVVNVKTVLKSFSELSSLRSDRANTNEIDESNSIGKIEFKEITGYIHNHNFEREFSFIRVSSDSDEGYPISNRDFPDIKGLRIGTPITLILEKDSYSNGFNIVDFKPCSYDDLDFVEKFEGTLKRISDKGYAIIKNEITSVFVPPHLAQNFDEDKIYNVECVAIESFDRKKGQMGWEALDVKVCN